MIMLSDYAGWKMTHNLVYSGSSLLIYAKKSSTLRTFENASEKGFHVDGRTVLPKNLD